MTYVMLVEGKNERETRQFDAELTAEPGKRTSHGFQNLMAMMQAGATGAPLQ